MVVSIAVSGQVITILLNFRCISGHVMSHTICELIKGSLFPLGFLWLWWSDMERRRLKSKDHKKIKIFFFLNGILNVLAMKKKNAQMLISRNLSKISNCSWKVKLESFYSSFK